MEEDKLPKKYDVELDGKPSVALSQAERQRIADLGEAAVRELEQASTIAENTAFLRDLAREI